MQAKNMKKFPADRLTKSAALSYTIRTILPAWFEAAISLEAWLLPDCFITADFSGIAATFAPVVEY